jgi:hypothetical protein
MKYVEDQDEMIFLLMVMMIVHRKDLEDFLQPMNFYIEFQILHTLMVKIIMVIMNQDDET